MVKMINIRNSIIAILCGTIIFMAIGFMVLSVRLDNKNKEINSYKVIFKEVIKDSSTRGGNIEPKGLVDIAANGKELDMNFTLYNANDELSYIIKIKNEGTVKARIVDLLGSPDYQNVEYKYIIDPVVITSNNLVKKELAPLEEIDLKISVKYSPSIKTGVRTFNYKLGLITEFVN